MPYIEVKLNRFDNYEKDVEKTRQKLEYIISELYKIRGKLDSDITSIPSISSKFRTLTTVTLPPIKDVLKRMESFLGSTLQDYTDLDLCVIGLLNEIDLTINQEKQKEREKREKYVLAAKIGVAVIGAIATVAVMATAGPVAILTVSVVKTVVTTTVKHLGDSYIDSGEIEIQDWSEYGKDLVVDVIVDVGLSAAGNLIGDYAGGFLDDAIENATKLTTRAGLKVVQGTISGVSSNLATGMVERYVKGFGDAVCDVKPGDTYSDFLNSVEENATSQIFNGKGLVKDLVGGVADGIGDGAGCIVDEKLGSGVLLDDLYSTDTNKRIAGSAVLGATTKVSSGIVSRGAKSIVMGAINEDLQFNNIVKDTFDTKSILTDIAGGATKQGIKSSKEPSFMDGMNELDRGLYDIDQGFVNSMPAEDALRYIEKTNSPK